MGVGDPGLMGSVVCKGLQIEYIWKLTGRGEVGAVQNHSHLEFISRKESLTERAGRKGEGGTGERQRREGGREE